MIESQESQLIRIIGLAHKSPDGAEWVRELQGVDTPVIAMAVGSLVASIHLLDPVRLREAALAVVQARVIDQQSVVVGEIRRLIETTERLERRPARAAG